VAIALCANSVIPIALNAQKLAHKQNTQEDGKQARPMTQLPLWWVGITTMIAGESLNFLAYGYAPASIVAPIGATSVFVNGIITTTVMKEPFTCRSGVGLVLIACGVVTLVTAIPPSGIELTSEMLAT
jgi:drug/metabolite transporter (DMT)-like permease